MKTMIAASCAIALAALAGCDSGSADGGERATTSIAASSPFVDKLKTLNEMNRGLALRRAIQDSGATCKKVERSGYQEDYKNLSMWIARCAGGKDWALFIAPNGDVQVRSCADAGELKLPACRFEDKKAS